MRIHLIMIMMILLLPVIAYGQDCFAEEQCTLFGSCLNQTYADSSARISIFYPNGSNFVTNESMTVLTQAGHTLLGRFNYTFLSPNIIGNYMTTLECNVSGVLAYDTDEFTIGEGKLIADEIYDFSRLFFLVFIFLIHYVLLWVSLSKRAIVLMGISALAGLVGAIAGITSVSMVTAFGSMMTIFFSGYAMMSIGLLGWCAWKYDDIND